MPAEKPPTKSSENRRSNKPIMEKRRRARINSCLNDLKALILEALKKDPARHSKLEKADILEMTVKHLQNLQRQQMALSTAADPNVANKFRAGFNECATEVTRYLNRMDGLDTSSRQRLLSHLTNCLNGMGAIQSFGLGGLAPATTMTPPMAAQPLNIHVPMGVSGQLPLTPRASPTLTGNKMDAAVSPTRLHLVPTRLPNGDFALLLPASYALTTDTQTNNVISLPSDTNTTPSQNALAPLTVNLPSRLQAPSDASPSKQSVAMMPAMIAQRVASPSYQRIVKMEPQMEELYHHEQFIKSAASPVSCRSFTYDGYSSPVRSEVFCKETMHKLEPWRPW